MATKEMAAVSKLDYLKKYMSTGDEVRTGKSKKSKKKLKGKRNLKIIDNDVKFQDNRGQDSSCDEFDLDEEKPQVYVDGNTLLSEHNEQSRNIENNKWAPVSWNKFKENKTSSTEAKHENNKRTHNLSPDLSPERVESEYISEKSYGNRSRKRHDSPDLSPQRQARKSTQNISAENTKNKKDFSDLLPESFTDRGSPDLSPKRRRHLSSSPDLSPLRKRNSCGSSPDLSPKRPKKLLDSSEKSQNQQMYPKRERLSQSPDLSPKRTQSRHDSRIFSNALKQESMARGEIQPEVVTKGKKSGLQSARALREENIRTKALEDKHFATMEKAVSGRGAATVYRKGGKKIDLDEEKRKKADLEIKRAVEQVKYNAWHKGLKQKEEYDKRLEVDIHEMSKPLARYQDDKDLDELLKQQERDEDPMLAFIRKTKSKSRENKKEKPRYKGPNPPPNRFNLWPGYRWDGVDRSNGFEKKRFATIAERQSLSNDAYKWSVEDM